AEAEAPDLTLEGRKEGQRISERVREGNANGLETAGHRERGEGRRSGGAATRIGPGSKPDPGQRDGQEESEGVGRTSQQGGQHSVPHQLHEREREAHDRGGGEDETQRRERRLS